MTWESFFAVIGVIASAIFIACVVALVTLITYDCLQERAHRRAQRAEREAAVAEVERIINRASK